MIQFLKTEFVNVARAYFLPLTFLYVWAVRGWAPARDHWLAVWRIE